MTDIKYGVELEIPKAATMENHLRQEGAPLAEGELPAEAPDDTEWTYEWIGGRPKVYGYEARTTTEFTDAYIGAWYSELLAAIYQTLDTGFEPCGIHGDTTAGLHLHLSPISDDTAELLHDVSQEPWMQVLACSSIAGYDYDGNELHKYPVLRSEDSGKTDYCRFGQRRNGCIRERSHTHYEWRLPEPMIAPNFHHLINVVEILVRKGADDARERAEAIFEASPEDITSIRRARMLKNEFDDFPRMKAQRTETTDKLLEYV
jgi:hypothetical protein